MADEEKKAASEKEEVKSKKTTAKKTTKKAASKKSTTAKSSKKVKKGKPAPVEVTDTSKDVAVEAVDKPTEAKTDDKVAEPKAAEPKAAEPKAAEPKAAKPKAAEPKAAEPKADKPKAAEPKAAEPKAAEPKADKPKADEPKVTPRKVKEPVKTDVMLITGFPGFIAGHLVKRLAKHDPQARFIFLVVPDLRSTAESRLSSMDGMQGRWEVITGDITLSDLGFGSERYGEMLEKVTHVWHLAAIYDLSVPERIAIKVNIFGTINVLDFCQAAKNLKRFNYVSTCYVSGERKGIVLEDELDLGQSFKNQYEKTKFWAEYEVQRRFDRVPTTIYRPGIVVGDSQTGETDKYDGPYYLIKMLMDLPKWLPMVNIGRGEARVNIVPVDFLTDAMVYINYREEAVSQVFQLADPNPMRSRDIVGAVLEELDRRPALATLPASLVGGLLKVSQVRQLMQMPQETVIYFNHDALHDSTNMLQILEDSDIRCPHLTTYLGTLVDYVRRNPNKGFLDARPF